MNDRPSIWKTINQGNPPRALDPETHEPWPEMTTKQKIVAWFWEREGRKLAVKLSAMVVPIVAIICGKLGVTPSGTEAIGIGLCALVPQCLDWVISRVGRKMGVVLKPLTKIIEEQEAESRTNEPTQPLPFIDPQPTITNIPRLGLGESLNLPTKEEPDAVDVVPAGIWIAGIRDAGSKLEFRKPFSSLESAKAYVARADEIYGNEGNQAEATIYSPGEIMPMTKTYE